MSIYQFNATLETGEIYSLEQYKGKVIVIVNTATKCGLAPQFKELEAIYQTYKDKLPVQWAKRCEHWYTEFKRVEAGAEAWRRGDLEEYGRLSFESGWSSIHNWESGAPEQIKLYEIMRETAGIYGGRFSGAGFKGCCMALIDPNKADDIREEVERKYLTAFPEMRGKYSFHLCESADGVGHKTED